MKHIVGFKESFTELSINLDLKDLCEGYLAYLLDSGKFKLGVSSKKIASPVEDYDLVTLRTITLEMIQTSRYGSYFRWSDVKDDIIPIVEVLRKNYDDVKIVLLSDRYAKLNVHMGKLEEVKYNIAKLRGILIEVW